MSQYRRKLAGAERETSLSVFTTWELSYQQLLVEDTDDKSMADLLTLLAFFAADGVYESIFKAYCGCQDESTSSNFEPSDSAPDCQERYSIERVVDADKHLVPGAFLSLYEHKWDSDSYCDALATIAQLSVVEGFSKVPDGMYKATLHPLVRDWIRLRTGNTACAKNTYLAATCIHRLLQPGLIFDHFFTMSFSIGQGMLKRIAANMMNMEAYFPHASNVLDGHKRAHLNEYDLGF
jgi:hypothetical protein